MRGGEVGQCGVAVCSQVYQPWRRADEQRTRGQLRRMPAACQVSAQQRRVACLRLRQPSEDGGGRGSKAPEVVRVVLGRSRRELLGGSLPPAPSRREDVSPRYLDVDTAARAGPQLLLGYLLPIHGHRVELDQQHIYGKGVVQPVLDMLVLRPEDPPVFVRLIEIRRTRLDLQADETARRAAFALHLDLRVHAEVGGALLPEDQAEPSHQDLAHPNPFAVGLVGIRRDGHSPPVLVLLPEDRRGHRHYG